MNYRGWRLWLDANGWQAERGAVRYESLADRYCKWGLPALLRAIEQEELCPTPVERGNRIMCKCGWIDRPVKNGINPTSRCPRCGGPEEPSTTPWDGPVKHIEEIRAVRA